MMLFCNNGIPMTDQDERISFPYSDEGKWSKHPELIRSSHTFLTDTKTVSHLNRICVCEEKEIICMKKEHLVLLHLIEANQRVCFYEASLFERVEWLCSLRTPLRLLITYSARLFCELSLIVKSSLMKQCFSCTSCTDASKWVFVFNPSCSRPCSLERLTDKE